MTSGMPWRVAIGKELRALLPMWAATMVALAMTPVLQRLGWNPSIPVFMLGAFALGAQAIGHEYSAGALATLLALPVSRTRLMATKLVALLTLLIPLAALMFAVTLWTTANSSFGAAVARTAVILALGMSVFVAPWMSMLARGPLGGVVFTVALLVGVPSATLLAQRLAGDAPESGLRLTPWPFVVVSLVSAVLGWRTFTHLEAIDGPRDFRMSTGSDVPSNVRAAISRRPALLALTMKELQLQQMTFIVAALSLVVILMIVWAERHAYTFAQGLSFPMSVLHLLTIPILAGALASAEERTLGTLDWQALQPVAAWKQWAIKISVAIGLALVLGVGGPVLLAWIDCGADLAILAGVPLTSRSIGIGTGQAIMLAAELALISAYVSSFSTSGLRAAIVAVPVMIGFVWLVMFVLAPLGSTGATWPLPTNALWSIVGRLHRGRFTPSEMAYARWLVSAVGALSAAVLAGLLLRFGLRNHRASRPVVRDLIGQAAAVGLWAAGSIVTLAAASAWYWTGTPSYISPAQRQSAREAFARRQRSQESLTRLIKGFDGRVGVLIDSDDRPSLGVHQFDLFPMQSVMKLPLAIAVLDTVDRGKLRLDEPVLVRKEDLSVYVQPIAKLVGPNGFKTTIDDLTRRAIVDSDNAAADILVKRLGGPGAVQAVLKEKGFKKIRVDRDEKHLQSDINGLEWRPEYVDPEKFERAVNAVPPAKRDAAFEAYLGDERDTTTPFNMTFLLESLVKGRLLSPDSSTHLLDILQQTTTTPDRLKAGVPAGWTIGHKSGTSGEWRGLTAATNDVGIITGPKGEKIYISVFIAESRASATDRAALIAIIARMAVDGYK